MGNEITEYRKASAEALGFTKINVYAVDQVEAMNGFVRLIWHPDKDLNQMGMVEDWLIEQHLDVKLEFEQDNGLWLAEICKVLSDGVMEIYCIHEDQSKPIAFMKAFMEYIKSK